MLASGLNLREKLALATRAVAIACHSVSFGALEPLHLAFHPRYTDSNSPLTSLMSISEISFHQENRQRVSYSMI